MTFREFLQAELARRCEKNGRYSLRSFARQLGVDHSTLSQIIRGRRSASTRVIHRLGAKLGLERERIDAFCTAQARSTPAERAALDAGRVLAERHHLAILELTRLPTFQPDARWIARVLGLSLDSIQVALARLARLRLLEMRGEEWHAVNGDEPLAALVIRRAAQSLSKPSMVFRVEAESSNEQEQTMGKPVTQFQLVVQDPERAAAFYGRLFGWRAADDNGLGYRTLETNLHRGIGGGIWPSPPGGHSFVQLFVEVDDVQACVSVAQAAGGKLVIPPQQLPDGQEMAIIADPEGVPLGVYRSKPCEPLG